MANSGAQERCIFGFDTQITISSLAETETSLNLKYDIAGTLTSQFLTVRLSGERARNLNYRRVAPKTRTF
jgi:hypothetical protein